MTSPETGEFIKKSEGIQERQEEFVVPEKIQDIGIKTTRSQVAAQTSNDDQIIKTPIRKVTVTLPTQQDKIENWARGDVDDSSTWLGYFWIRMIKKALHFGWDLVVGSKRER